MLRPFGPLRNPAADQFDLRGGRFLSGFRGRHPLVGIVREHPPQGFAFVRLAGDEGRMPAEIGEGARLGIQSQIGLSLLGIRAVTVEAISRQDRANVAIEVDVAGDSHRHGHRAREEQTGSG